MTQQTTPTITIYINEKHQIIRQDHLNYQYSFCGHSSPANDLTQLVNIIKDHVFIYCLTHSATMHITIFHIHILYIIKYHYVACDVQNKFAVSKD